MDRIRNFRLILAGTTETAIRAGNTLRSRGLEGAREYPTGFPSNKIRYFQRPGLQRSFCMYIRDTHSGSHGGLLDLEDVCIYQENQLPDYIDFETPN